MNAYIRAIEYYLPEKVLTNSELSRLFPEWSAEKVFDKLGIKQRHISEQNESASFMAIKAAEKLFLHNENIKREDIDFILFCTQSPDYRLPSSACIIQNKLGIAKNSGALDFDLGCSGWVYGLALAKGLIFSGSAKNILLLTGETYTKYIAENDKSNRAIFSDGASACVISCEKGFASLGNFVFGTDGSRAEDLIMKPEGLFMNGGNIFAFTLKVIPSVIHDVLAKNFVQPEHVGLYVMHQANKFMLESLRKKMNVSDEKFLIDLDEGNTVSSTVPVALKNAYDSGKIHTGSNVIISGFGVGLSWSAGVLFF